ncbi:MAG: hypothetical protein KF819_05370 [Labilithrix sp.]|nr:hypothetical protein [Labilithrix sp.]
MGIDRIGKGGAPPPAPDVQGTQGASRATAPERPFEVDPSKRAAEAAPVDAASASTPLARLRAGEIDVHGYVDLKVDEATAGLEGLSAEELADIKTVLRDQLRTDPGLADLVRSATGKMPTPPED